MNPTGKSYSFRSCVRASEATCAHETMLLRGWAVRAQIMLRRRGRVPVPFLLSARRPPTYFSPAWSHMYIYLFIIDMPLIYLYFKNSYRHLHFLKLWLAVCGLRFIIHGLRLKVCCLRFSTCIGCESTHMFFESCPFRVEA